MVEKGPKKLGGGLGGGLINKAWGRRGKKRFHRVAARGKKGTDSNGYGEGKTTPKNQTLTSFKRTKGVSSGIPGKGKKSVSRKRRGRAAGTRRKEMNIGNTWVVASHNARAEEVRAVINPTKGAKKDPHWES